jgi:hypothetical protein
MVIDRPSGYKAMLGRMALNELKAVMLKPYLTMKFTTDEEIGVQKGG